MTYTFLSSCSDHETRNVDEENDWNSSLFAELNELGSFEC